MVVTSRKSSSPNRDMASRTMTNSMNNETSAVTEVCINDDTDGKNVKDE